MDVSIENTIEAIREFTQNPCEDDCKGCPLFASFGHDTICAELLNMSKVLKSNKEVK